MLNFTVLYTTQYTIWTESAKSKSVGDGRSNKYGKINHCNLNNYNKTIKVKFHKVTFELLLSFLIVTKKDKSTTI